MNDRPIPYGRQSIDDEDIRAVVRVLEGDWLTTGPAVDEFEREIEKVVGGESRAITVTSGTAALHVAYAALGVEQGDEVVTTPLTFVATAAAAMLLGARVRFADIDVDTGLLSIDAAAAELTSRTKVIAAVDYAGLPVDGTSFAGLAHRNGALFLQDAAHSIGSSYDGVQVGNHADATTFSFFPTKNMTTAEGGAVLTQNRDIEHAARLFKNHGLVRDPGQQRHENVGPWHQEVHALGLNYRLPDVLAALGTSQIRKLETFKARRQQIFDRYVGGLADVSDLKLPAVITGAEPTWHLFPIRVPSERRRRIFEELRNTGIGVQVNYVPVYWHPIFEDLGYRRGQCPNAEKYYSEEISLPMYVGLTDSDVDRVISEVRRCLT